MKNSDLAQDTPFSFKNYLIYIGIDVHEKSWKVTIRLENREMKTFSSPPSAEALHEYLLKNYPDGTYLSVYEAGFCGFSAHRKLVKLGMKNIIVNPSDIPMSDKDKKSKSDTRDSRTLAKELERGSLTGIYVLSLEDERYRTVFRLRKQFEKEKRRTMVRIRSFFFTKGVSLPRATWGKASIASLRKKMEGKADEFVVNSLLDTLDYFKNKISEVSMELKRLTHSLGKNEEKEIIETAPGVGPATSEALLAEIIDPRRFKDDDHICSYVGLIPNTRSSGENERSCGLTKRRNGRLRHVIIEAAWVASKKDPELSLAYAKLTKRMKAGDAIIRIAKKLLIRIKRVWTNMEPYKINVNMTDEEIAS